MKPVRTYRCPLCGGTIAQLEFDPFNRWQCSQADCWLHANPIPERVAGRFGEIASGMDWAADNGFWLGCLSAGGLIAAIAGVVWFLR